MKQPTFIFVSGFLGSGKTTLLTHIANHLSATGKKLAFIVNEAGASGVDDAYFKQKGYSVSELYNGCVCCTLAIALEKVLNKIIHDVQPDIILMEPSGIANPNALYHPIEAAGYATSDIHHLALIDPVRAEAYYAILEPFYTASLPLAERVILNKIDVATPQMRAFAETIISKLCDVPIDYLDLTKPLPKDFCQYLESLA